MTVERCVGLTILPEYIQTEGIDGILENLHRAGVTAVSTSPYVMEPATVETGSREPPGDAKKGIVRLLDRPLWGQDALYVRTEPSWEHDLSLYEGLRYQPDPVGELSRREGHLVSDFVCAAKEAGFKVYFQIMAAVPPSYRVQFCSLTDDDMPRLPDGSLPKVRIDKNGSLASPNLIAYENAFIRDLCKAYPEIDGFRVDWPEYPPYSLDGVFLDFSDHAATFAERLGLDFKRMRRDVAALRETLLGGLSDAMLADLLEGDGGRHRLLRTISSRPGIADWLHLKSALSTELLQGFRQTITAAAGPETELIAMSFPAPFSIISGLSPHRLSGVIDSIQPKFYTMHWPTILKFYGDTIMNANPKLSEILLVKALVRLMDIADDEGFTYLSDYHYPEPDDNHPVGSGAIARKIRQARSEASHIPVTALAHGYGPLPDVGTRLEAAWHASGGRIWMNRYCYLTNEKLDQIKEITSKTPA